MKRKQSAKKRVRSEVDRNPRTDTERNIAAEIDAYYHGKGIATTGKNDQAK